MLSRTARRRLLTATFIVPLTAIGLTATPAYGSGFQLSEQSVTGLGRAFAGSGVVSNDASVIFYNAAEADLTLPETGYFSGVYRVNEQWEVYGTSRWTRWERFDVLRVGIEGIADEVTPQHWENSWMHSIGASYEPSNYVTLRAGVASDRSPVPNESLRTPRIPDSDRDWVTVGLSLHHYPRTTIDLGLAYLDADEVSIDKTVMLSSPVQPSNRLSGSVDSSVTIAGAQIQYEF